MNDIEKYINELKNNKYISENGSPLKCPFCNSKEFEDINEYFCSYSKEEYDVKCKSCGKIIGHWAYGYWSI